MPDDFDPYYHWLGIPPEEQPPSHYQLLGLRPFEENPEVISNAYDQRMAHIRTFQNGVRGVLSQQILRELAVAGNCLLDAQKKRAYDHQLAKQPPLSRPPLTSSPSSLEGVPEHAAAESTPPLIATKPASKSLRPGLGRQLSPRILVPVVAGVCLLATLLMLLILFLGTYSEAESEPTGDVASSAGGVESVAGAMPTSSSDAPRPATADLPSDVAAASGSAPSADPAQPSVNEPMAARGPKERADDGTVGQIEDQTGVERGADEPEVATRAPVESALESGPDTGPTGSNDPTHFDATTRPPEAPLQSQGRYALAFAGQGAVELARTTHLLDFSQPFTIEMWYRPEQQGEAWLLGNCAYGSNLPDRNTARTVGWQLWHLDQDQESVHRVGVATGRGVMGDVRTREQQWRHVAFCSDGQQITLFSDGRRAIVQPLDLLAANWLPSPLNWHLGSHGYMHASQPAEFVGAVRGLHVTNSCRYKQNFPPSETFSVASDTQILLDFDYPAGSPAGKVVQDLSGNGHHGTVRGAKWIRIGEAGAPDGTWSASGNVPAVTGKQPGSRETTTSMEASPPVPPVGGDVAFPATIAVSSTPATDLPTRAEVPSEEQQQEGRAEIRQIFRDEFKEATSLEAKLALSRKLQQLAEESREDAVARFVLLQEAQQLALEAGGLSMALPVLQRIADGFAIDVVERKQLALTQAARDLTGVAERERFTDLALAILEEALLASRFDSAKQILQLAQAQAARVGDVELRRRVRDARQEADRAENSYEAAKKAEARLQTDPENAALLTVWARHRALHERRWQQALPSLAKCDNSAWSEAARADLAQPAEAEAQVEVGNLWWELSEHHDSRRERLALRLRARHWYLQALPQATGLTKVRARERIEQLEPLIAESDRSDGRAAWLPQGDPDRNRPARQPLPADVPAAQAGLIGRLTLQGQDVGLLFKYQFGFGFSHAAIENLLNQPGMGEGPLLMRLLGAIRLPKSTDVIVQLEGGSEQSVHSLSLDGKQVLQVGGKQPIQAATRLTLAKGEHTIGWELQGRLEGRLAAGNEGPPAGAASLGTCRLTLVDSTTGKILAAYHGGNLLMAASRLPSRATVEMAQ